ncbi:MAG: hypothetical protein PWP16_1420 [Eubacteriaceae bacterium]|nr:hypothetical protein [Eubacteriaceae bacterium]MDN5308057.1 hypothetical protein [Eubacteriaceae bacterium]
MKAKTEAVLIAERKKLVKFFYRHLLVAAPELQRRNKYFLPGNRYPEKRAVRSTANLGGTAEKYNRPLRDAGLFLFGGKCLVWHNVKIKEK